MVVVRALVLTLIVSSLAAGTIALVSRTPESFRRVAREGAVDAANGASFTAEEIKRHAAFRGPLYLAVGLVLVVEVVALVLLARGPFRALVDGIRPWGLQAAAGGMVIALWLWIAALPIAYVRGFAIQHAWGLSTQGQVGWITDQVKGVGLSLVISAVAALAFVAALRASPRALWLIGWAVFALLNALLVFLFPIVIAPIFNRFTPADAQLAEQVRELGRATGVTVDDVFIADASRRTRAENAYVAGLGATKRVVLDDNLVAANTPDERAFVIAHELGHASENHVLKGVALSAIGLFAGFGILVWLGTRPGVWSWAGASGIGDIGALPVVVLIAVVLAVLSTPLQNVVSRDFEATADRIALEATDDPEAAVRAFRRLAFANIADLNPPPIAVATLYTHPPLPDRIEAAVAHSRVAP